MAAFKHMLKPDAEMQGRSLVDKLAGTRLLARGPKAKGAIRAAGLHEQWSPPGESSSELISELLDEGVDGLRVGVQMHGATTDWEPLPDLCEVLREAGATIVPIPVYRWVSPDDPAPMTAMIDAVIVGELDAVTFTSAPAVASMLGHAEKLGVLEAFLNALRVTVPAMCVGNVTAGPLHALGVPTLQPNRFRLGALARLVAEELPANHPARKPSIEFVSKFEAIPDTGRLSSKHCKPCGATTSIARLRRAMPRHSHATNAHAAQTTKPMMIALIGSDAAAARKGAARARVPMALAKESVLLVAPPMSTPPLRHW